MSSAGNGRVVLITGSSSGIGAATALLFAKRGFQVVVTGSNGEKVDKVVEECNRAAELFKLKALGIVADLSEPNNGQVIVEKTIAHFKRLDILINNAGTYYKTHSGDKSSFELYKRTMAINCESVIKTTMEALPHLEQSQQGANIVFVSSVASIKPGSNGYAYRMSKAALSSYAKCLAVDIAAKKIRVNIVSPGPVSTPIFAKVGYTDQEARDKMGPATLLGRVGESEEIASTIFYLASEEASFVNGAELFVDGGYLLNPTIKH